MIKSKKQMFIVISVFALILFLGATTYAFFNYTRTGSPNNFSVGRIYFSSENEETITLSNLFPIDPSNTNELNDPTKVGTYSIDIVGDTDYSDGIEYLVSIVDSNLASLPISVDVTVSNGLGVSNNNYFMARESKNANIYKKLIGGTIVSDQPVLVGYIMPNSTPGNIEGVEGTITIKAYLDQNKILISDTYDGTESDQMGTPMALAEGKTVMTTDEWNSLSTNGVSFKIKVEANEGIWVNRPLDDIVRMENINTSTNLPTMDNESSTFVSASTGIDFGQDSSDTNGKGVYMRAGTENDDYPIVYYRGAIEDNNVLFANKCWKMVRTTDTGGVKMIYSGEPQMAEKAVQGTMISSFGFTYDDTDSTWNTMITVANSTKVVHLNLPDGNGYKLQITGTTPSTGGVNGSISINGSSVYSFGGGGGNPINVSHELGTILASDTVSISYNPSGGTFSEEDPATLKVLITVPDSSGSVTCDNWGIDNSINMYGTKTFVFSANDKHNSLAYNGYMRGENAYEIKSKNSTATFMAGSGFTYENGVYTLTDTANGISDTRHYTCFTTSGVCNGADSGKVYYVYHKSGNYHYYIELTNGKDVNDALTEMQANEVNSNAKTTVDSWYYRNLRLYTDNLEDTIWCNDRSFGSGNNNGFNPNGGSITTAVYYGPKERSNNADSLSSVKNQPSLECVNKNDRFTVNNVNGNKKLSFPAALLTSDELALAGSTANGTSTYYLHNSSVVFWTMSPYFFYINISANFGGHSGPYNINTDTAVSIRPAISLKPGQPVIRGNGTANNPYIVE